MWQTERKRKKQGFEGRDLHKLKFVRTHHSFFRLCGRLALSTSLETRRTELVFKTNIKKTSHHIVVTKCKQFRLHLENPKGHHLYGFWSWRTWPWLPKPLILDFGDTKIPPKIKENIHNDFWTYYIRKYEILKACFCSKCRFQEF